MKIFLFKLKSNLINKMTYAKLADTCTSGSDSTCHESGNNDACCQYVEVISDLGCDALCSITRALYKAVGYPEKVGDSKYMCQSKVTFDAMQVLIDNDVGANYEYNDN